jgi:uncharacterized membrane protein (UPF0182 family)
MIANPNWDFGRALYFTVVSLTTVGYGDYYPTVNWHKIVNSIYLIVFFALVAGMLGVMIQRSLRFHDSLVPSSKKEGVSSEAMAVLVYSLGFVVFFAIGAGFLIQNEPGMDFFQAFSTVTTTLTTVGYGDFGYTKRSTRIFLIFYIFIGVAYTTAAFGSLVSWIIARERKAQFKNLTDMEKPELSKAFTSRMQEAGLYSLPYSV